MTDEEITKIRDAHIALAKPGAPFDHIGFANELLGHAHAAEMARWRNRWLRLPQHVMEWAEEADDPLAAGISHLVHKLACAQAQTEVAEASARAQLAGYRKDLTRLIDWFADVGLLHYESQCTRPDKSHGACWVLREPAVVNGDSVVAWSPKSAEACVTEFISRGA